MLGSQANAARRRSTLLASGVALGVLFSGCSGGAESTVFTGIERPAASPVDIAEVLAADADGRFTTLLAAVDASQQAKEALVGVGPITLFAPTNDAFDALGADAVASLLEDPEALDAVLLGHAVTGTFDAGAVVGSSSLTAANGATLEIGGAPSVAGAPIVQTDIAAPNGIIHAIGAVILPEG